MSNDLKVGDVVGFKSNIGGNPREQAGTIVKIVGKDFYIANETALPVN